MMSKRWLFYLLPIIIIFLWLGLEPGQKTDLTAIKTEQQVVEDFRLISPDSELIPKTEAGANYLLKGLYFPVNYSGTAGDSFYVGWAEGERRLTQRYLLIKSSSNNNQLNYVLKDSWNDYLPPADKFRYYPAQNQSP